MDATVDIVVAPAAELLKLLVDVELVGVGGKARLSKNDAQRFQLGYVANGLKVDFFVKTSHECSFVDDVQMLPGYLLLA